MGQKIFKNAKMLEIQNVYLIIENATDILNQLRHFNHAISALLKLRGHCVESVIKKIITIS